MSLPSKYIHTYDYAGRPVFKIGKEFIKLFYGKFLRVNSDGTVIKTNKKNEDKK
jgi:hypothetical protein